MEPLIPISALGFKARVDLSPACVLACVLFLRFTSDVTLLTSYFKLLINFHFVTDACDPLREPPNGRISYNTDAINGKILETTDAILTCNSGYHIAEHAVLLGHVSRCQIRSCYEKFWFPNAKTACVPSNGI